MTSAQAHTFEKIFGQSLHDPSSLNKLKEITTEYPFFTPAHFFLLQQTPHTDVNYSKQAAITALLFNNPHWLHFQLNRKDIVAKDNLLQTHATENNGIESSTAQQPVTQESKVQPTKEVPLFEPLFATDYFASQGIKITEDANPSDKLGKQVKSFTEWLKTMKKIHTEKKPDSSSIDLNVEKLAEKSNSDEEIITEAMAEVYLKQGKMNKAREIYQKLSLLNPHKSAYFAAKFEQIKEV